MSEGQAEFSADERYGRLNAAICERIRMLRTSRGLTLRDIEMQTGFANNLIGRLEHGQMNATPKYLDALAQVFECSPHDLLPPDATTISLSPSERRLLDSVRSGDQSAALSALSDCLGIIERAQPNPSAPTGEAVTQLRIAAAALTTAADLIEGEPAAR